MLPAVNYPFTAREIEILTHLPGIFPFEKVIRPLEKKERREASFSAKERRNIKKFSNAQENTTFSILLATAFCFLAS